MIQIAPHLIRPGEAGKKARSQSDEWEREEYNEGMDFEEKVEAVEFMLAGDSPKDTGKILASPPPRRLSEDEHSELVTKDTSSLRGSEMGRGGSTVVTGSGSGPNTTQTVKFTSSLKKGGGDMFSKEEVVTDNMPAFSMMTKTLEAQGLLNQDNFAGGEEEAVRLVPVKVFTEVGKAPVTVRTKETCRVCDLIELTVSKCKENSKPLPYGAEAYELRMLDEDDGTPDMDISALELNRHVHKFGASAFAMIVRPGYSEKEKRRSSVARGNQVKLNSSGAKRTFIRVYLGDSKQSYVLKTTPGMTLQDLIPLIAKKKQVSASALPVQMHNFIYYGDEASTAQTIDMATTIDVLASDTVQFLRKVPINKGITIEAKSIRPASVSPRFNLTFESAGTYCEYRVIKTNRKGRSQHRILGIDAENIHNKIAHSGAPPKKIFGLKTDVEKVSHPLRPISSIKDCIVDTMPHPGEEGLYFVIYFRMEGGKEKELLYKGETKMEVAEIVAKIKFLTDYHKERVKRT